MNLLTNRKYLLGVTGSIAAYKSLELIRLLQFQGAHVRTCPTAGALQFVTELSIATLSKHDCLVDNTIGPDVSIAHLEAAGWADFLVIAPATANTIAKLACGIADEMLLQITLSFTGRLIIAPAMEPNMWLHPATQHNVQTLTNRGAFFVGPQIGELASGKTGIGRMASLEDLLEVLFEATCEQDYKGRSVLITAGPTEEDLDPVRFLTNRSSGRMGIALARAFCHRGAQVTLVHGPLKVPIPSHARLRAVEVRSAMQMQDAVLGYADNCQIAVMCAAVADFRPKEYSETKIKKSQTSSYSVEFAKNPDILKALGQLKNRPFLVGFAAETGLDIREAERKLADKGCDLLCVNDVAKPSIGFDSEHNQLLVLGRNGLRQSLDLATKYQLAHEILTLIGEGHTQ